MDSPEDLGPAGVALWDEIAEVESFVMRPDEYRLLELACRQMDTIASLRAAFNAKPDYMVKGSTGQQVINPLIAEIRQASSGVASLLRQLSVPDDEERAKQRADKISSEMAELGRLSWRNRA